MKDRYIIFLDIDGTLLSHEGIHVRTLDGIRRAKAEGHLVFINSGRPLCFIEKKVTEPTEPDGIVSGMGTVITIGGKTVYSSPLSREELEFLWRYGEARGYYTLAESENIVVTMNGAPKGKHSVEVASTDELLLGFAEEPFTKVSFINPITDEDTAVIKARFPTACVHKKYVEIPSGGCSKATAIAWVCEHYGVDVSRSVAMGDSMNDLDMLKFAGISVAMGNALDEIKAISDFVSIPCNEGGVGYAIEELILKSTPDA